MRLSKQQMESSRFLTREVAKYLRDVVNQVEKLEPDYTISSHKIMLAMVGAVGTVLMDFQNRLDVACKVLQIDPERQLLFRGKEITENYYELFTRYLLEGKRIEGIPQKEGQA